MSSVSSILFSPLLKPTCFSMSSNRCSCWVFHVLAEGSLRPIAPNRCICLHGCGPFSPLQTGRLVPARDRCVGSLRCRNRPECRSSWFVCRRSRHASFGFRLVRSWGIVNAYLYMVAAGCQGRQAIAVRCIDMSQRADAVPVYPESTGLCTFHEEYQAFPSICTGISTSFSYSTMPE